MSSFASVRFDLNTLEQFFALTLEQEAELNSSLRGFFVKHGIPNTNPSRWLQDLMAAIVTKHGRSQGWLVEKVSRQTAKLTDTLPVANMDARLTSIHAFAVTKSEAMSNLQEEFFRLGDRFKDSERASLADLIDLASDRAFVVHEATRQRLQACAWDDRTSARVRARAIDAMRGRRERLVSLAEQQANLFERLEREFTKACINPLHVVNFDGHRLVLRDLFSAASKYKSLCLSVMRAEELKYVVNLQLIAAQSTCVQVEFPRIEIEPVPMK
ncbi:hypothetical protein GSI_04239 [Ganoderma sinense ZZ0214-1]|uniref:Uncharacterized protein n=1 Tax=Ganoderma sinense ZZ0214-1 TaxID=1077348 RepID=A0A2G8SIM2_9APHY|nr:hypothetical protein GSI_04239 [Ganoderma sinense ZZ0214-1]